MPPRRHVSGFLGTENLNRPAFFEHCAYRLPDQAP